MSAIGSVIVMVLRSSLFCGFPTGRRPGETFSVLYWKLAVVTPAGGQGAEPPVLPAGLGDAGELAAVGHLPQADPAQAELAVDGLGPAATLAAGVRTHRELGL